MSTAVTTHYGSAMLGHRDASVAKCNVRKEVVCETAGNCEEEKAIECVEICPMAAGGGAGTGCDDTKCEGEHGAWACANAAILE